MKKVFIGLLALLSIFAFANGNNVHIPGCEFESYTLDSSITIHVHQWMDLEYTWMIDSFFDICDYDLEFPWDIDLLSFTLDSNASVTVSASANWGGLDVYIDGTIYVEKDGNPFIPTTPIGDGSYLVGVAVTYIDPDTPAGEYTVELGITFEPTVTF